MTNTSKHVQFHQLIQQTLTRRAVIRKGGYLGALAYLTNTFPGVAAPAHTQLMGFKPVPASTADDVVVPQGYGYEVLMSWGDPIVDKAHKFKRDANAQQQALQFGDNTDGMELFFKADSKDPKKTRQVFAINNEYYNPEFLFPHGEAAKTEEDVAKAQHAVGVTLVEVKQNSKGQWRVLHKSEFNRRVHALTEFDITGPAAGHRLLQTQADPSGRKAFGTFNNCGAGRTPWGTYLTCEENFNHFFGGPETTQVNASQTRYGLSPTADEYRWWQHDARFNLAQEPNEPNRFGWIVEIDPFDTNATPKKRTALGRFKHENAETVLTQDARVVVYMGDDEKGEFIYKFVSRDIYKPGDFDHNFGLLDNGTLYVARFNEDGSGQWLPLVFGNKGLTTKDGFSDQADVLIRAREAGTQVGATTMDRPEWVAAHPSAPMVFCSLTNNSNRGVLNNQPLNGPNPRAANGFGQIVRWWPTQLDHGNDEFQWDLYVMAGNPETQEGAFAGSANISKDNMFNSPDGLKFDGLGRLWIQTDGDFSNAGAYAGQGNNQMLCGDPVTGEIHRFLVGPVGCEITGIEFADDHRSLFVGIQHPTGTWPDADRDGVPRSSVIVITKDDGGIIGS